nr:S-layer homology domain-containing protein [Arthrobacter sp. M2012083]
MFRRGVAWLVAVVLVVVAPGLLVLPSAAAADPVVENVISFADVPESSQFATEIAWLAGEGISTGWDAGGGLRQYRPLESIARDAMAAFLYRHAGSPAFTPPADSPFIDVPAGAAFYKEISWLASKNISTGWDLGGGKREYRPLSPIARDAMAAFLYRYASNPAFTAPAVSPFSDVPAGGGFFYKEITWLAASGISTGWDVGGGVREYRPLNGIARDAMAAFLYRYAGQKAPADPANPAAGTVTVAPNVEVLEPTQLESALVTGDTVVLPSDQATDIRPNDVIVSGVTTGTPDGLLARVVQVVRDPGGNTLVKTEPATLPEAIVSTDGLLEVTGTPVSSEFIPEPDVTVEPDAAPTATKPDLAQPFAEASADVYSRSFAWKKTFRSEAKSPNLTGTGSLVIESKIKASAKAKMALETGFLSLKEASVVLTPSTTASHSIRVGGQLVGKISAPLGELNSAFTFMAGPVPVVVTTKLEVSANLTVDGTAEIAFSTSQTVSSDHGFKYKDGSFTLINSKPGSHGVENTVKASASLTAKASLDFDATVKLYGIAGITFGAGPYVSAAIEVANTGNGPTWSCPIELGFAARLGLKAGINIMGINLGEWEDTTTTGWTLHVSNPCENKPVVAPDPTPEPTPTPTPTPTATDPGSGGVEIVSFIPNDTPGNRDFYLPSISGNGQFVAFTSAVPGLVSGDENSVDDVFVKDMSSGTVRLVSATPQGQPGDLRSDGPAISADGKFVAFVSDATNLSNAFLPGTQDIYIRDLTGDSTQLVSATPSGNRGNGGSLAASVSSDGRFVAFFSTASDLVAGDSNGVADVFVRDVKSGTTRLISASASGGHANGSSDYPSISADGRFIAFSSSASNLVAGDTNGVVDVFVHDTTLGSTRLVSTPLNGQPGKGSGGPSISADGRYVAYHSFSTSSTPNVFLRDMETGQARLVSEKPVGSSVDGFSVSPSVSGDGRYVAFITAELDMLSGATKQGEDIYVRDMQTGAMQLVSRTPSGLPSDDSHLMKTLSADGRYVAFSSTDLDLRPDETRWGSAFYRATVAKESE